MFYKSGFRLAGISLLLSMAIFSCTPKNPREVNDFTRHWRFHLGDDSLAFQSGYDDGEWRSLHLPHDWSIEGEFSEEHATTPAGGALPAGMGWYRKTFSLPTTDQGKQVYIDFDGIYRNSEVWINGEYLGKRPFGYISFRYDLTPYLHYGDTANTIAVKVDNSVQPNSRWYTGAGIYRNVHLVKTGQVHVDQWGTFVTTPEVSDESAQVSINTKVVNKGNEKAEFTLKTVILDPAGKKVGETTSNGLVGTQNPTSLQQDLEINQPQLWSVDKPNLYKAVSNVYVNGQRTDRYETTLGIRYFDFDAEKGFSLNGEPTKILGVCLHHDLGALGAAVNKRAIERRLESLKEMGCNGIRTAHNPPSPEMLALCDEMGFIVMDEAFDVWAKKKAKKDYHLNWEDWHKKDLQDLIKRDRNHPSIFMWSIGNEIREQFDSTGIPMTRELVGIVKELDTTRPVTCALTENVPEKNFIYQSGALDLLGFNYKQEAYPSFPEVYPGEKIIATENMSALATRGHYDMPSDSIRRWPEAHNVPIKDANPDHTVSAYDNVSAYWGSTHEETWGVVKDLDFLAGLYVWTGVDYLGEPTPYDWPARSSYFGIIDLAGFPKDSYYMYQSEWTDKPVLHVFPHWNWEPGQAIDVWAYYNQADEVELFLNGESKGVKKKGEDDFHVMWRLSYEPGTVKVVSRKDGETVLTKEIKTAGKAAGIRLSADRSSIQADGKDLSFITAEVVDENGIMVPDARHKIQFEVTGPGFVAGVSNGYQASHAPFKANYRKAWKGKCLAILQSEMTSGKIKLKATAEGLEADEITVTTNNQPPTTNHQPPTTNNE